MANVTYTVVTLAGIGNINGSNATRYVITNTQRPRRMRPTTDRPSEC